MPTVFVSWKWPLDSQAVAARCFRLDDRLAERGSRSTQDVACECSSSSSHDASEKDERTSGATSVQMQATEAGRLGVSARLLSVVHFDKERRLLRLHILN